MKKISLHEDKKLSENEEDPVPNCIVKARTKTDIRRFIAEHALLWIRTQHKRRARGAIMIDIDDTIIDANERTKHGFEFMKEMYSEVSVLYPVHIVTARPDDQHSVVMKMLKDLGFCIPPDRLHMLPSAQYGKDYSYVERFKWKSFLKIAKAHGGVIARFGDKLWDVAHYDALSSYMQHIDEEACIFMDRKLKGTVSGKLPSM